MLKVVRRSDAEIKRLLNKAAEAAASDIERLAPEKPVRRGQLTSAFDSVKKTLRILFDDVGDSVRTGRTDAANAAMLSTFEWEEPLYIAAGLTERERAAMREATTAMSDRNVELMLRRFNTEQIPLSRQVYKTRALAQGWVDRLINIGIGRGLTARELAKEVKSNINPRVRGGVNYAAMRLARTEINNSFHTAAIVAAQDRPWVTGMQWRLSGSHPALDICDLLAEQDEHGLGEGIYPPGEVPRKPHPHCFCFITPTLQDEDEFIASLAEGMYDEPLAELAKERISIERPEPEPELAPRTVDSGAGQIVAAINPPKEGEAALQAIPRALWDSDLDFDKERMEFQGYKGFAYINYNQYLRSGLGEFYRENIENMDRVLDSSRLREDAIFWRGVKSPRDILGDLVDGDLTGTEWQEDAFSSMSADKRVADDFAIRKEGEGLRMRITVRRGAPMLRLSRFAGEGEETRVYEAEGLGGRGWRMRITADHGVDADGVRNVDVEVISHARNGENPWSRSPEGR